MKLSDYIWKALEELGVEQVFLLPGGGAMHLVDSLGKSDIPYVCFQHEQGAAIAAEGYAQYTNRVGVVLTTSGPGATNAITGVTAGWIDSTPMFIISGQAKRKDLIGNTGVRQSGSQEVQIIDMVRPITKYAVQIMEPENIKYHIQKAWHEATTGRPGPVWLSIPLDVQSAQIEEDKLEEYHYKDLVDIDIKQQLNQIVQMLHEAKKPLLLLGNGVKLSGATDLFLSIARRLKVPVQTTWKTEDAMDEMDPLYVGHPGAMGDRGANYIVQEADFFLSVGSRLDTAMTAFNDKDFARNARKVIVDIDEHEIARMQMKIDVALPMDANIFLQKLSNQLEQIETHGTNRSILEKLQEENGDNWLKWIEWCKNIRKMHPIVTNSHKQMKGYVSAYYFIDKLCDMLKETDYIVPESSGGAAEITGQAFRVKLGQKIRNAAGLGSMGFGLPYAIGASIAGGNCRTILIDGDGAFQLNIQELETLYRLKLPIKIFIWNNDGYVSIRNMQKNTFSGHLVASSRDSGYSTPNISRIAEAYGLKTYQIYTNEEIDNKLLDILKDDGMMLCEIFVNPSEGVSPRVKAEVGDDGSMIAGRIDNMWPYSDEKNVK